MPVVVRTGRALLPNLTTPRAYQHACSHTETAGARLSACLGRAQLFEMNWVRETVTKFSTKVVQARREQMEKMVVLQAKARGMDPRRALRKVRQG